MSSWQFDQVWKFESKVASLASATPGMAYTRSDGHGDVGFVWKIQQCDRLAVRVV